MILGCDLLLEVGSGEAGGDDIFQSTESFWRDAGIMISWDVVAFCVLKRPETMLSRLVIALDKRRAVLKPSSSNRVVWIAARLADVWPEVAFPVLLNQVPADGINHPFATALESLCLKWQSLWRVQVLDLVRTRNWPTVGKVLTTLPKLSAQCLADASAVIAELGPFESWPVLSSQVCAVLGLRLADGLSEETFRFLVGPFGQRSDVASLRDGLPLGAFLPASAREFSRLWKTVDAAARKWLLRHLSAAKTCQAYRLVVLEELLRQFDAANDSDILRFLWESLPQQLVAESLSGSITLSTSEPIFQCLSFVCSQTWSSSMSVWPLRSLTEIALDSSAGVKALEMVLTRCMSNPDTGEAVATLLCRPDGVLLRCESELARLVKLIAESASPAVHASFCKTLLAHLVAQTSPFRLTVSAVVPSLVTVQQQQQQPQPWSSSLWSDLVKDFSTSQSQRSSVPRRIQSSVGFGGGESASQLCAALGRVLVAALDSAPETGLAMCLARQLEANVVPRNLHHPLFDMDAYASSLPRTHKDKTTEDVVVEGLFSQNPVLYEVLLALSVIPAASSYCFKVAGALLCHLIGHAFAQRSRRGPVVLSANAIKLLRFLVVSQCLPPIMCRVEDLCLFASPQEAAQLFLSCWRFLTRFPPMLEEFDAETSSVRTFSSAALNSVQFLSLSFRLCVANNVAEATKKLLQ